MRINSISFSINSNNTKSSLNKVSGENKGVIKPLETDTVLFKEKKRKKREKGRNKGKDTGKMPAFVHSFLLNRGQKRAKKLEIQAKDIMEDAMDAIGFSYVGDLIAHSKQTVTDGVETNGKTRTTAQIYEYKDGDIIKAELDTVEDLKTGTKNIGQIFEFEGGKLSSVYENYTKLPDGTVDFQRKYKADEKGHLKCVYNKVL